MILLVVGVAGFALANFSHTLAGQLVTAFIGLGLLCQMPIVVIALSLLGLIDYKLLSSTRLYAYTCIMILAAIVAPSPDPVTFFCFGLPMIALYEACIWIVWAIDRRKARAERLTEI